jgi:hypothetical protein
MNRYEENRSSYFADSSIESEEYFDAIREILAPEYQILANDEIDNLLAENLEGLSFEEIEGILSGIGKILGQAASTVLPIAGTAVGTIYGGPAGGALGGAFGGAVGKGIAGATQGGRPSPSRNKGFLSGISSRNPGKPVPPRPKPSASLFPPKQTAGGTSGAGGILALINNRDFLKGLLSLVMKEKGAPSLPVGAKGTKNAPPGAFVNLLLQLAKQATEEAQEIQKNSNDQEVSTYLMGDTETQFIVDAYSPRDRAKALLYHLKEEKEDDDDDESIGEDIYDDDEEFDNEDPEETMYDSVTEWFVESGLVEDDRIDY